MDKNKKMKNIKSLIILLVLSGLTLYTAISYRSYVQQLKQLELQVKTLEVHQNILIQFLELDMTPELWEDIQNNEVEDLDDY